jgi:hypothetical protein
MAKKINNFEAIDKWQSRKKTDRRVEITPEGVTVKYAPPEEGKDIRREEILGKEIKYGEIHLLSPDIEQLPEDPRDYEIAKADNTTTLLDRLKEESRKERKIKELFIKEKTKAIKEMEDSYGLIESGPVYEMMQGILKNLTEVLSRNLGKEVKLKLYLFNRLDINAFVFGRDELEEALIVTDINT